MANKDLPWPSNPSQPLTQYAPAASVYTSNDIAARSPDPAAICRHGMGGSAPSGCSDRSLRLQRSRPGTFPPPDRVPGPLLGANSQLGACASGTGAQANNGRRFSNSLPQIIRRSVIRHRSRVRSGKQHDTGISQPAVCALNCLFDSRKLVIWAYGEAETPNLPCHRLLDSVASC